jgi:hypothetical protein
LQQLLVASRKITKLLHEVLNVAIFAIAVRALRCSVLGAPTLNIPSTF